MIYSNVVDWYSNYLKGIPLQIWNKLKLIFYAAIRCSNDVSITESALQSVASKRTQIASKKSRVALNEQSCLKQANKKYMQVNCFTEKSLKQFDDGGSRTTNSLEGPHFASVKNLVFRLRRFSRT